VELKVVTYLVSILLVGAVGLSSSISVAAERHVHGEAEVEISLEPSGRVSGQLRAAMDAFLPFEHVPKTDAQRKQLSQLRENLRQVSFLLSANAEAGCTQTSIQTESALFKDKAPSGHSDLELQFSLQCANPSALRQFSFDILKRPGRLKKVELEFAGPKGQSKAILTPRSPVFQLP
jgi:hypothetical protein